MVHLNLQATVHRKPRAVDSTRRGDHAFPIRSRGSNRGRHILSLRLQLVGVELARLAGKFIGWIKGAGITLLLWLIAALVVAPLLFELLGVPLDFNYFELTPAFWDAVGLLATLAFLSWALRARRRLVVEEFADHLSPSAATPGDAAAPREAGGSRTAGLATLLTLALTRLADLHHGTDQPSVVSTHAESGGRKGKMVLADISRDADPDFLRNAVSAESNVSLGPLNIPVGLLVGLLGRFARGPRLVGSLHRDGELVTLTAQVSGAGRAYGWKVKRSCDAVEPPLDAMVEELACRIYTDLAMDRTTKWRATRRFGDGLDAYRDTLRTPLNRRLNLRLAERSFLEASAEDQNFDLAYYNLGVVYRDLGKPQAAYGAYVRTIELNADRLEAYYALAANRWQQGDYAAAVALCDRVLAGEPGAMAAEAHNLRSLALGYQLSGGDPGWREVLHGQRRAVKTACRTLRRAYLSTGEDRDRPIERARVELSTCLVTLTFACREAAVGKNHWQRTLARAESLIQRAVALDPSASHVRYSLGDVRSERGLHREAAAAFREGAQIAPEDFDLWAHLALALAKAGERSDAMGAVRRALGSPYSVSEAALQVVANALRCLGEDAEATRIGQMKSFLSQLAEEVKVVDGGGPPVDRVASMSTFLSDLAEQMEQLGGYGTDPGEAGDRLIETRQRLRKRIATEDWSGRAWERSQTEIVLAYLATRDDDWVEAEGLLELAIAGLEHDHPREIGDRGLRAELARVRLNQGRKGDALASARAAVDLDPLSPKARAALAEVRSSLGEHEAAREALEVALLRAPEAPEGHVRLGQCLLTLAGCTGDRAHRERFLRSGIEHLRQALDLLPGDRPQEAVAAHELLGRLHLELRDEGEAIARFEIARALRRRDSPAALERLAEAYLGNGDYPHAETVCLELIERVGEGDPAEVVDRSGGVEYLRGELLAKVHLLRAQARVERDVELHRALELVRAAKRYIRAAREAGIDPQRVGGFADVEAQCWAHEGLVLHKQGKLDEALRRLEHAALLNGAPAVYLHLALVSAEKVDLAPAAEGERHTLLARAAAYCRRAAEADVWEEQKEEIGEVSGRVSALREADGRPSVERPSAVSALDENRVAQLGVGA